MKKLICYIWILLLTASWVHAETNPQAKDVQVNTSTFTKNLNSTDNTVQKALNTIDQTAGSGGGSNPAGPTGTVQINGGGGNLGAYNGSTCGNQIAYSISASGTLGCVPYLSLTSFSGVAPITYNSTTGAIGWTNSLNYITLTALNSTMSGLTYNNATGNFSLTSGYYFPTTTDQTNWNAKQVAGNYITALTGDATATGPGSAGITFATVNGNVGTFQGITVNAKGLVTSATNQNYLTTDLWTAFGSNIDRTTGNVGIGSTLPGQPLDVFGLARATGFMTPTGTSSQFLKANGTLDSTSYYQASNPNSYIALTALSGTSPVTYNNGTGAIGINTTGTWNGNAVTSTLASTVTTNANLTGPITSSGNATSVAVQTGTGSTFVMQAGSPNFTGNVGVGSAAPGQAVDVQGTVRTTNLNMTSATGTRPAVFDSSKNLISGFYTGNTTTLATSTGSLTPGDCVKIDANGNYIDAGAGCASNSAAGSTSYVQYNNAGSLAGSSNFVFTGTNVGVGSVTPGKTVDVQGTVRTTAFTMSGQTPINGYVLTATDSAGDTTWLPATGSGGTPTTGTNMLFGNGSGAYANVTNTAASGGNIGLGTTTALNQILTVQGNIAVQGNIGPTYFMNTNIGIGSLTPGQILDVQGTVRTTGFAMPTGASSGYVLTSNGVGLGTWQPASTASGTVTNVTASSPLASSGGATPNITVTSSTGTGAIVLQTSPNLTANVGIGSATPGAALDVAGAIRSTNNAPSNFVTNVGIGSLAPGQALDVNGTIRALSAGACSYLYKCVGGVDAGVIQTSACNLCPAGSCTQMNGCF